MVAYIRSDLDFILEQIKISEAHAAGQPLFGPGGLVPAYNVSLGLRTVDGTYNHLLPGQETWGAANQPFPEPLGTNYRPADGTLFDPDGPGPAPAMPTAPNYNPSNNPNSLVFDSSLRTISNLLVDQTLGNPAAVLTALERAGSADPMADLAAITPIYQAFKPAFDAEYQARVVMQTAKTAADELGDGNPATPPSAAEQAALLALASATAAHALTVTALDAARGVRDAALEPYGIAMDGDNVHLPNVAPDEGLSAPFNSWFTLFGQFFDHGLDLVNKGGSGTVFVPLQPDDPLYVEGSHTNFMVLTRATVSAGNDGIMGTPDDVRPVNTTTAFVDQNQTYTSHPSHQVFLREYVLTADGPVATGKLIEGPNGGMANWGQVKVQAADILGIQLTDSDVGGVPLVRTDAYGNFIPGANGFPQLITGIGPDGVPNTADDIVVQGNPAANAGAGVSTTAALRTSSAFLADIAHEAVPVGKIADGDITIGLANPGNGDTEYDNELLDAHFIAGDGRANENIGLTAVHHVFHAEHNRLVEHTKEVTLATGDLAFLNEWLAVDVAALPTTAEEVNALVWDGERLFQAAKFGTEMQYQHLVFEEFARKIQPQINPFLVPDGFDTTMNPSIVAEFAHVVYRFGHSMLTESIDRFDPNFVANDISLIQGFLNPTAFNGPDGVIDDGIAAGAIIRGMTRQVGNEIDEFVTSALRNNLLGLPLDLATINLARGRDTGVPSLNAARADFYEATDHNVLLKPYESWVDFAGHLKHEASIINFIASYGTHPLITGETTIEGKRDAALTLITGAPVGKYADMMGFVMPTDAVAFLNATGNYALQNDETLGGLNNVDLWIGGLAEETMPFGGMLGSTFNFVFEVQMENLQSGDRFYYLQRLDGMHLFGEMEANSFASLIMRNTDATHLPSDVFSTPGLILEVDRTKQFNPGIDDPGPDGILLDNPGTPEDESADNTANNGDPVGSGILTPLVIRDNPATPSSDTNYLRYTGGDHVVLGGTEAADILIAGIGDDTLFGDGGNDNLQGGFGNDIINAGAGDDIVTDSGGDDNIKAGDGNDVVHAGPGLDLVMGGRGQDFIVLGTDAGSEVFAGEGNDFVYGNKNAERILGNEGNDWIETGTFDGAPGDNFDEIFSHDGIDGHDVFLGDGGFDEFIGEGGDDIMVGSPGRGKMVGMSGWDWATYKDSTSAVNADLSLPIIFDEAPTLPPNAALDEFQSVEGLSGSRFNDILKGSNVLAEERVPALPGGTEGFTGSALDADGVALISGLQDVVGAAVTSVASYSAGDIILGGDGSDEIWGQAGDDIIDGDKWLNVRISVRQNADGTGAEIASHNSMTSLSAAMFAGTINPGQLVIVREILQPNMGEPAISDSRPTEGEALTATLGSIPGTPSQLTYQWQVLEGGVWTDVAGADEVTFIPTEAQVNRQLRVAITFEDNGPFDIDTARYSGSADDYEWALNADGSVSVTHTGGTQADGTDTLRNIERLQFSDEIVDLPIPPARIYTAFSAATTVVGDRFDGNGTNEIFEGTAGDDVANGNGGDDLLTSGAGDDTLNGGEGDDRLDGGDGVDILSGGAGNDAINGGIGSDTAIFSGLRSQYQVTRTPDSSVHVVDLRGGTPDGADDVRNVEFLQFSDMTINTRGVVNHAPVAMASNFSASQGQVVSASSLFTASDVDGNSLLYFLYDNTAAPTSGHFTVNGVVQAAGTTFAVSAAQLALTTFTAGAFGSSDDLFVNVWDGSLYSGPQEFHVNVAANQAPTVTAPDFSAAKGQIVDASSLFAANDADGDNLLYFFYDNSADPTSGHFTVNGVVQAAGTTFAVSAAQLALTTFTAGAFGSSDDLFVNVWDGELFSGPKEFHVNVPANRAPTATASDISAARGDILDASSLFAANDADGDNLLYFFYDNSAESTSGHFTVDGAVQAAGTTFAVSAAQLALTTFTAGLLNSDDLFVNVWDGELFSGPKEFHVNVPANQAPEVTASNQTATSGQSLNASSLFTANDADGDSLLYFFYDNSAAPTSGHFTVDGVVQAAGTTFAVSAEQLAQTTFIAGTTAGDDLFVNAWDGSAFSGPKEFHIDIV